MSGSPGRLRSLRLDIMTMWWRRVMLYCCIKMGRKGRVARVRWVAKLLDSKANSLWQMTRMLLLKYALTPCLDASMVACKMTHNRFDHLRLANLPCSGLPAAEAAAGSTALHPTSTLGPGLPTHSYLLTQSSQFGLIYMHPPNYLARHLRCSPKSSNTCFGTPCTTAPPHTNPASTPQRNCHPASTPNAQCTAAVVSSRAMDLVNVGFHKPQVSFD